MLALVLVIVTFNLTRSLPLKAPIDDLVTAAKVMAAATLRLLGVPA